MAALVLVVAIFFLGMGIVALARPEQVVGYFGTRALTADGRNEVRAVYGGFGVAMAGLLVAAPFLLPVDRGIYIAVGAALAGMAAGRVVAAAVERPQRFYPSWFYCVVETLMALTLFAAAAGAA